MKALSKFIGFCLLLFPLLAAAHKPSDSYLFLTQDSNNQASLRWDIALRDLEQAIGIDQDGDGNITWGELKQQQTAISAYAISRLQIRQGTTDCQPVLGSLQTEQHTDGTYAVLNLTTACAATAALHINYSLLFDVDPTHRGILLDQRSGAGSNSTLFSVDQARATLDAKAPKRLLVFTHYVHEGIWHIWIGLDHVLFIILLILPAVLALRQGRWEAVAAFRPALFNLLKVITAFTLAHSITLSLAATGMVILPSWLVESAIALSIVVVAVNIFFPVITHAHWKLAFAFGLLHGFGFASVLADLGMPTGALAVALVGFNLGVELGQLAIVLALFPVVYLLRPTAFYRTGVLYGSAALTSVLASIWFVERLFDLKLINL